MKHQYAPLVVALSTFRFEHSVYAVVLTESACLALEGKTRLLEATVVSARMPALHTDQSRTRKANTKGERSTACMTFDCCGFVNEPDNGAAVSNPYGGVDHSAALPATRLPVHKHSNSTEFILGNRKEIRASESKITGSTAHQTPASLDVIQTMHIGYPN